MANSISRVRILIPCANPTDKDTFLATYRHEDTLFVPHSSPAAVGTPVLLVFAPQEPNMPPWLTLEGVVRHARRDDDPHITTSGMHIELTSTESADLNNKIEQTAHKGLSFTFGQTKQTGLLQRKGIVIGIDLGTVNTCVAVADSKGVKILRSPEGYEHVPSVVYLGEDGQVSVGHKAVEKMVLNPERSIYGSKRFLGRPYASKEVRGIGYFFHYELAEGPDGKAAVKLEDATIPLEYISAHILRACKAMASEALGEPITRAVVTVPAYFGENQRESVREAGRLAGLYIERIINEPTAAAVAYGYGRGLKQNLLIYDLGGGTFDVSILRMDGDTLEVIATDGDPFLGGQDFDDRLTEFVLLHIDKEQQAPLRADKVAMQRLRMAVQSAKHQLSEVESCELHLPFILPKGTNRDIHMVLERRILEELTQDLVSRTLDLTSTVLSQAKMTASGIDEILLVGGQSRSPHVRRTLIERFQKRPSSAIHPDQAVALGAALVARATQEQIPLHLFDVLPASLRLALADGQTALLLPRGARLPVSKLFDIPAPAVEGAFRVTLCRGEGKMVPENTPLGHLLLESPKQLSQQQKIRLQIAVDAEGLLQVSLKHPQTGEQRNLQIALKEASPTSS